MKIMFICTSNVCRSVIAEAILKEKIKNTELEKKIEVCSSGIFAQNGDEPMLNVVEAMAELRNKCKTSQSNSSKKCTNRRNGLNTMCSREKQKSINYNVSKAKTKNIHTQRICKL